MQCGAGLGSVHWLRSVGCRFSIGVHVMTISGINSSSYISSLGTTGSVSGGASSSAVKAHRHHSADGDGGQMMQSITQALSQMGISLNQPSQTTSATGQTAANSSATQNPQQALHQLMHDIFEAAKQQSTSSSSSADASSQYADFSSRLQSLINSLSSNSSTATSSSASANSTLSQLQSDFSSFLTALQTANGGSSTANNQNVLTFLKNLQASMGSGTAMQATGSLIGTTS